MKIYKLTLKGQYTINEKINNQLGIILLGET